MKRARSPELDTFKDGVVLATGIATQPSCVPILVPALPVGAAYGGAASAGSTEIENANQLNHKRKIDQCPSRPRPVFMPSPPCIYTVAV